MSTRYSVLYQGASRDEVLTNKIKETWNLAFWRMDASVKYRINKMISLNLNLANITSQPDIAAKNNDNNLITKRVYYGMTAMLGVEFKF